MFEDVWVELNKTTGEKWSGSFPVPKPVLLKAAGVERSAISEERFSWILAGKVPTVVLASEDIYRLELPLNGVLAEHFGSEPTPGGEYDLRLSTIVQLLVGPQDGSRADLAPIRLNITSVKYGIRQRGPG